MNIKALSAFNGISLTKSQWLTVLKGSGCPFSPYFWTAFRDTCLIADKRIYTMLYFDEEAANKVQEIYSHLNRSAVKKSYKKKQVRKQIAQRKVTTIYIYSDGTTSLERPERN